MGRAVGRRWSAGSGIGGAPSGESPYERSAVTGAMTTTEGDVAGSSAEGGASPKDDTAGLPGGYRAVFDAAPDGILIVDAEGVIREVNRAAVDMFGHPPDELRGRPVEVLVPPEVREHHAAHRAGYVREPRPRPMGIGMELRGARRDGSLFPVEISLSPLRTDAGLYVIATVRDLTERLRLRRFGTESLRAMEEERHRIARELHDDMAQRLSTLLVTVRLLFRMESEDERERTLEDMREMLLETAEGMRRIARGLRPPALADAGLDAAIRGHIREVKRSTRLEVDLSVDAVDPLLGPDRRLVVYRVVQEALSNVVRHAEVGRAAVDIERRDENVVAIIRDEGRGFEAAAREPGEGLGLIGMEERAEMVGGTLHVESRPGEGTTVRLEVPLEDPQPADG